MKKILILYGLYGSGHKSIAQYVKKYFEEHSDYELKIICITDYCNFIGKLSVKSFDFVIKHRAELLFNAGYEIVDNKFLTKKNDYLAKILFDNPKLREDIVSFNPDLTINTHFFGANIISYYNSKNYTHSKFMTILTDYKYHSFWLSDQNKQEAYIVANDIMRNELIDYGIDFNKVFAFGIPFDKEKSLLLDDNNKIQNRYKLRKNYLTYLFFGGGSSGSMAYYEYFKSLVRKKYPINIVFVCGKNERLKHKCEEFVQNNNIKNVKVLGFTTDVYNLLKVADCVISKPGGATITECMEMKTPMILIPGYGGQEKYNARFIKSKSYGTYIRGYYNLTRMVKKTFENPEILTKWKNNLNKNDSNNSTEKIFELAKKILNKK